MNPVKKSLNMKLLNLILLTISFFVLSCSDDTTTSNTSSLKIGDEYQGGKIAYIFQPRDLGYVEGEVHGIIASPTDKLISAHWGCYGANINYSTPIEGARGHWVGQGKQNTIAIVNRCLEQGIAAKICSDMVVNGYDDWFLPSIDELRKLYENREAIGTGYIGYPPDERYWSSTEYEKSIAWHFSFYSGVASYSGYMGHKNASNLVRAIRYF